MESKSSVSQEVTVVQLSEKDKQALQEKYKEQRQAMWSGKQSTSQESDEETTGADQDNSTDNTTDSIDTESSDTPSDSSSIEVDQPVSTETSDQETIRDKSDVQTELEAETAPIADDTGEQQEEDTSTAERVFWEADQGGGPSILTWKLVLAVIGVAVVLVGVGVYLGFVFAG